MSAPQRLIVGITGASGAVYGIRLLEAASRARAIETHLVMSETAKRVVLLETGRTPEEVEALASVSYANARPGGSHRLGFVLDDGHGRRPVFHQEPLRDRPLLQRDAAGAGRRRALKERRRWCWWCGRPRCIWATCV